MTISPVRPRRWLQRPDVRRLLMLSLATVTLLLDQASKGWALERLPVGHIQPLVPGLLQLRRVSNTGAAFSLFTGSPMPLGLVSALVSLGLLVWILRRPPASPWNTVALSLLLGGAMGNGIDRWRSGAVVDFLEFIPIHFPIFNLADVAINLAVACFLIELLRPHADRHA